MGRSAQAASFPCERHRERTARDRTSPSRPLKSAPLPQQERTPNLPGRSPSRRPSIRPHTEAASRGQAPRKGRPPRPKRTSHRSCRHFSRQARSRRQGQARMRQAQGRRKLRIAPRRLLAGHGPWPTIAAGTPRPCWRLLAFAGHPRPLGARPPLRHESFRLEPLANPSLFGATECPCHTNHNKRNAEPTPVPLRPLFLPACSPPLHVRVIRCGIMDESVR